MLLFHVNFDKDRRGGSLAWQTPSRNRHSSEGTARRDSLKIHTQSRHFPLSSRFCWKSLVCLKVFLKRDQSWSIFGRYFLVHGCVLFLGNPHRHSIVTPSILMIKICVLHHYKGLLSPFLPICVLILSTGPNYKRITWKVGDLWRPWVYIEYYCLQKANKFITSEIFDLEIGLMAQMKADFFPFFLVPSTQFYRWRTLRDAHRRFRWDRPSWACRLISRQAVPLG